MIMFKLICKSVLALLLGFNIEDRRNSGNEISKENQYYLKALYPSVKVREDAQKFISAYRSK